MKNNLQTGLKVAIIIKKDGDTIKQKHKLTNVHTLADAQQVVNSIRAYAQHLQAQIIREQLAHLQTNELEELVSGLEEDARYGDELLIALEDDAVQEEKWVHPNDGKGVYRDEYGMPHLCIWHEEALD